jgi:hypothetical protein
MNYLVAVEKSKFSLILKNKALEPYVTAKTRVLILGNILFPHLMSVKLWTIKKEILCSVW